jgi:DNA polymerase III epsilon subunit family exonuclease
VPLLQGQRVLVLDLETTGFRPRFGAWIVEAAYVAVEDGRIADEWSSLIRGPRPIPPDSIAIHGITDEMVRDAPPAREVAATLRAACGDHPLVFHNASFDLGFLAALMREAALPALDAPVIDTLGLAREFVGDDEGASLGEVAARLGVTGETAHRALGDARTTARCLIELAPRWQGERGVNSWLELAAASQDVVRRTRRLRAERRAAAAQAAGAEPGPMLLLT